MIIDTNMHLGHWPFRHLERSDPVGLLALMDRGGLAQAWVGSFEAAFYRDLDQANRMLLKSVAGLEERLLPWISINPAFPAWEQEAAYADAEAVHGVRLYPNYHGYDLSHPALSELLAVLAERSVPVAIYHKLVDERLHHWTNLVPPVDMDLAPIVAAFPELPILLCGCGLAHFPALNEVVRQGNVFVEISRYEGVEGVRLLADHIGLDRVVFGSFAPYFYLDAALLKIVEAGLDESEREQILYRNAQRLLGGSDV